MTERVTAVWDNASRGSLLSAQNPLSVSTTASYIWSIAAVNNWTIKWVLVTHKWKLCMVDKILHCYTVLTILVTIAEKYDLKIGPLDLSS